MAREDIRLQLNERDWKRYRRMTSSPVMRRLLRREIKQATILNSRAIKREIKREIRTGKYARNSELTIAIKGSDDPLRDTRLLVNAISVRSVRWDSSRIGVVDRGERTKSGLTMERLAMILQRGATIPVTPSMRGLFYHLWLASIGRNRHELNGRAAELFQRFKDWKPLSPATKVIVIPPRPFVATALSRHSLKLEIRKNYRNAVQRAWSTRRI